MPNENSSDRQTFVKAQTDLLEQVGAGRLEGLLCPKCKTESVSVWFKGWERTLLKCEKCDFDSLVINSRLPKFYNKDRDLHAKKELMAGERGET